MAVIDISNTYQLTNVGAHIDNTDVYNSNRNLLDNAYFKNVVNQRGNASYSANAEAYWIDRWIANGSFSVSSSGLSCSSSSWYITQYFEEYRIESGKVYTLSALFSDGTIWKATGTVTTSSGATSWQLLYGTQNTSGIALRHYSAARPWQVALWINEPKTVIAIKLEKGSYSTILNDVPPDYGEELAKCQRYFLRIPNLAPSMLGAGFITSGGSGFIALVPTPVTMRTAPSVSASGAFSVRSGSSNTAVAIITVNHLQPNGIAVAGSLTGTANAPCYLFMNNTGYVDFSADL